MPVEGIIHVITSQDFEAACKGESWTLRPGEASIELNIFWHAIHYLVTGDANLTFLLTGVQIPQVSEKDAHCEVHSPQDVAALHARLSTKSAAELMSAFDSTKFDALGIYGGRWAFATDVSEPYTFKTAEVIDKLNRDDIQKLLVQFIAFVKRAAENGYGFFVTIM